MSDSFFHFPKFSVESFKDIGVLTEALWMIYNKDDSSEIPKILKTLKNLSNSQSDLTEYVANCKKGTVIENDIMQNNMKKYIESLEKTDLTSYVVERTKLLLKEVEELLKLVQKGDFKKVVTFVNQTKHLFRGAIGVRHVDFIGYKQINKK